MHTVGEKRIRIIKKAWRNEIWQACSKCGRERWVRLVTGVPRSTKCYNCAHNMPNVIGTKDNEVRRGDELGKKSKHYFIWHVCQGCGEKRWVVLIKGKPLSSLCHCCAALLCNTSNSGSKHWHWKGGKTIHSAGYVMVWVGTDDFFFSMATKNRNYVPEHRLVMAKHLGRCLLPWEIVHHKNGIKCDNRLENLLLLPTQTQHTPDTLTKSFLKRLQKQVRQLTEENVILRQQIGKLDRQYISATRNIGTTPSVSHH